MRMGKYCFTGYRKQLINNNRIFEKNVKYKSVYPNRKILAKYLPPMFTYHIVIFCLIENDPLHNLAI